MTRVVRHFPVASGTVELTVLRLTDTESELEPMSPRTAYAVTDGKLDIEVDPPELLRSSHPWFLAVSEQGFGRITPNEYIAQVSAGATSVNLAMLARTNLPRVDRPGTGRYERVTVPAWEQNRGEPYFIAHRGSGDVFPENSMAAFEYAVAAGAQCMEVSVARTLDGALVVNHDTTWDRTTTSLTGPVAETPAPLLRHVHIDKMTQTGDWTDNPHTPVLFEDILTRFGGKVIICAEAKLDAAYPQMVEMIERYGLKESTIIKAFHSSSRLQQAKLAGYRVFAYFGNKADITQGNVQGMVNIGADYLVIPYFDGDILTPMPDEEVLRCVNTGIPTWMYPLHRRRDVGVNTARGVVGFVTSGFGYVASDHPRSNVDSWWSRSMQPGELTTDQSAPTRAPAWNEGAIVLDNQSGQHFISLGAVANPAGSYTIEFEARWTALPDDLSSNLTLAFGRADDTYYEHQYGQGSGYHAILRPNGNLQLYQHTHGSGSGTQLGSTVATDAAVVDTWMTLTLTVTPSSLTWERDGFTAVTSTNSVNRGAYIHLGKSAGGANRGVLELRNLVIT